MHLGDIFSKCDWVADVEEILRECLEIRERKEPDRWLTFNTMSLLCVAGPEEGCRGRVVVGEGLRRNEGARKNDSAKRCHPNPRSPRSPDRVLHSHEQHGKDQEVQ
jgi:hypothetical protein